MRSENTINSLESRRKIYVSRWVYERVVSSHPPFIYLIVFIHFFALYKVF